MKAHKLIKNHHPILTFTIKGEGVEITKTHKSKCEVIGNFTLRFGREVYQAFIDKGYKKEIE